VIFIVANDVGQSEYTQVLCFYDVLIQLRFICSGNTKLYRSPVISFFVGSQLFGW
jgi:hypothetical protein